MPSGLPTVQTSIVMSLAKIKRNESPKSNSGESVEGQCKKVPGDKIESGDQLKSYGKCQLEMKYCKRSQYIFLKTNEMPG